MPRGYSAIADPVWLPFTFAEIERFWAQIKVDRNTKCWVPTTRSGRPHKQRPAFALTRGGSGLRHCECCGAMVPGTKGTRYTLVLTHVAYNIVTGGWPKDRHLVTTCLSYHCVNPDHMTLMTQAEKMDLLQKRAASKRGYRMHEMADHRMLAARLRKERHDRTVREAEEEVEVQARMEANLKRLRFFTRWLDPKDVGRGRPTSVTTLERLANVEGVNVRYAESKSLDGER